MKKYLNRLLLVCALESAMFAYAAPRFMTDELYRRARHECAEVRMNLYVMDDEGFPIENAAVKAVLGTGLETDYAIVGTTDTNGMMVVEGKTNGSGISISSNKEGYYGWHEKISFASMGHEYGVAEVGVWPLRSLRWLPWGMEKKIVLRKIRSPSALQVSDMDWRRTTNTYQWVGFDLAKYDFVAPNGFGDIADMEVKFDWDGGLFQNYNGMTLNIRFPQKSSGGYFAKRNMPSDFKDTYRADTNETFLQEFEFHSTALDKARRGHYRRWDKKLFNANESLVIRSRCKFDMQGRLESAVYFLISDFAFACSAKGASMKFRTVYNPTPNDTNLEPKW